MRYTDDQKTEIKHQLVMWTKHGHTVKSACLLCEISEATFYNWLNKRDDFRDRIMWARTYALMQWAQDRLKI